MKQNTVHWEGASGKKYEYWVFPRDTTFVPKPGNYIFAQKTQSGELIALYVGETENLRDRLNGGRHERADCAERHGWNSICAHLSSNNSKVRRAEETDIRIKWDPPCNRQ